MFEEDELPSEICEAATGAENLLIPQKSRKLYENTYNLFNNWKASKNTDSSSETVLLAYFFQLSKKYKPSSLWSTYSMLKSVISTREKIDINQFHQLTKFLKSCSKGFQAKKSQVFQPEDMQKFLSEASDHEYLAAKVIMIFGVCGACRGDELIKIRTQDISAHGNIFRVMLPDTKTGNPRFFTIGPEFYDVIQKYQKLRPEKTDSNRFFVNFQKGKCTNQVIGKNKIAATPREIALFLNLPNPDLYTGHSFRRTSATILADSGANITTLKRHGGWKSDAVAEGYIQESLQNKTKIGNVIASAIKYVNNDSCNTSESTLVRQQNYSANVSSLTVQQSYGASELLQSTQQNCDTSEPPPRKQKKLDTAPEAYTSNDNYSHSNKVLNFENCTVTLNIN